jgi:hypothetical protein
VVRAGRLETAEHQEVFAFPRDLAQSVLVFPIPIPPEDEQWQFWSRWRVPRGAQIFAGSLKMQLIYSAR